VTALVLYLTAPEATSTETASAAVTCAPDLLNRGLACAARF
jgi:hypothetical protein